MKQIERNDPVAQSADVVTQNIEALKLLFPDAVAEGKIDLAVIKELIGESLLPEEERDEKYGLNWFGKRKARQIALTPSTGTLRPCPEDSVDWATTKNLMIEGDNLEVLKLLQKSYAGKVKLIYIDPPYNTGKDFVYPDNFQDNIKNYLELTGQIEGGAKMQANTESSGRYHTDWLNMMYPRLKLARNLLRDDGILYISIDNNEYSNLKILGNELFGEENSVIDIAWQNLDTIKNDAILFSKNHESILVWAKNITNLKIAGLMKGEKQRGYYKNRDNDKRGDYLLTPLHAKSGSENSKYKITLSNGQVWEAPAGTYPRYSRETLLSLDKDGRLYLDPEKKNVPQKKTYWTEVGDRMPPPSFWDYETFGSTRQSNAEVSNLVGKGIFQNPKPLKLLKQIFDISGIDDNDIVVDFFAGSATTGHGLWQYNTLAKKKARFVLVQLPEKLDKNKTEQKNAYELCTLNKKSTTIFSLSKERLRRAGNKIKEENPMFTGDTGFRVFKLDTSNIRTWEPDWDNLEEMVKHSVNHIKDGRSEEDILYELLLKLGLDLSIQIEEKMISNKKVQAIGVGTLMVCLDKSISRSDAEPLALGIIEWHKQLSPVGETTCVFLDSAFSDDVAKSNLSAILQQHGLENVRSL